MKKTVSLVAIAGAALFASIGVLTGGTQLTLVQAGGLRRRTGRRGID